jgi:hypothetical protein
MSIQASSIWRNGLAVIAGLAVGSAVNMGLITLNIQLFPMPKDVSFDDKEGFADYIASLPSRAYILVFAAHFGQAVVGGYLAASIARPNGRPAADMCCYVVGALTMLGAVINATTLPAPKWTLLEIPMFPVLAWFTAQWAAVSSAGKDGRKGT